MFRLFVIHEIQSLFLIFPPDIWKNNVNTSQAISPTAQPDSIDDRHHPGDYLLNSLFTRTTNECLQSVFEEPPTDLKPVIIEISPAKASISASRPQFSSPSAEGRSANLRMKLFSSPGLSQRPRCSETIIDRWLDLVFPFMSLTFLELSPHFGSSTPPFIR